MNWYYARGDERMGPVDDGQFEELVASGAIGADTLVWREGMADWAPLSRIPRAAAVGAASSADSVPASLFSDSTLQSCVECGRGFPAGDMVAYENNFVCAECKPIFFQRLRESGGIIGEMRYGGFWIRFVARFLDGIILGIVGFPLSMLQQWLIAGGSFAPQTEVDPFDFVIMAIFWLIQVLIGLAYEGYFVGRYAATPGKMVCGLQVVMSDGGKVSYARACGRYLGTMLSSMTLLIGYIIAAFDSQKRALHDHICDTRVIRK